MDEHDGEMVLALKLAQIAEKRGDFLRGVLVDAMQPDKRIQKQQNGLELGHGFGEPLLVGRGIDPQDGGGDDLNIELFETDLGGEADALEALSHDVECIFGGEEQNAPGSPRWIASQARCAGGDTDRHVQSEERFAALGLAADDADGLLAPQRFDEPALGSGVRSRVGGRLVQADGS